MPLNVLMIEVPSAQGDGSVPFGVLYATSSIYRSGHNVKILDLVKENYSRLRIRQIIEDFRPQLIGLGGITSSYKNCKELVAYIRRDFDNIKIVVGGILSSVPDLLLEKAGVDYIVHGEGEITFSNLIDAIEHQKDILNVKGISLLIDGKIFSTKEQPQIDNLDTIPLPEYKLLDLNKSIEPVEGWIDFYFKYDRSEYKDMLDRIEGKKIFPIITARGCTHKCIFCYRHQVGWRQHSVGYVVNMIRHLRDKYGIGIFQINDELTTVNKRWVLDFCQALSGERPPIAFIVLSSRVDMIDKEMLVNLKKAGCIMINYGYESASDLILKEIKKGTTREEALKAGLLTRKVGIKNVPEIMIGFPSENEKTVADTIDFLKKLDTLPLSINTPIPFPRTRLWDYGVEHNIIKDKESFVLGYKRKYFVNFTKYSDRKVLRFAEKVKYDVELNWFKKRNRYKDYFRCLAEKIFFMYIRHSLPDTAYRGLRRLYRWLLRNGYI